VREGEAARRNPWGVIFVQKIMSLSGACNASAPLFSLLFLPLCIKRGKNRGKNRGCSHKVYAE
ncbi:hypothetical protein PGN92_25240, partial [Klebsiella aerogenes]